MDTLADALVRAMAFIDSIGARHDEGSAEYEAYVEATTAIFMVLRRATASEQDALAAAAERAAGVEQSRPLKSYYHGWMESVFAGSWHGNRRASAGDGM